MVDGRPGLSLCACSSARRYRSSPTMRSSSNSPEHIIVHLRGVLGSWGRQVNTSPLLALSLAASPPRLFAGYIAQGQHSWCRRLADQARSHSGKGGQEACPQSLPFPPPCRPDGTLTRHNQCRGCGGPDCCWRSCWWWRQACGGSQWMARLTRQVREWNGTSSSPRVLLISQP